MRGRFNDFGFTQATVRILFVQPSKSYLCACFLVLLPLSLLLIRMALSIQAKKCFVGRFWLEAEQTAGALGRLLRSRMKLQ